MAFVTLTQQWFFDIINVLILRGRKMTIYEIQNEILRLKKENDVCILAHSYQGREITEIADIVGDSFALSEKARGVKQKTILSFCPRIKRCFSLTHLPDVLWLSSLIRMIFLK